MNTTEYGDTNKPSAKRVIKVSLLVEGASDEDASAILKAMVAPRFHAACMKAGVAAVSGEARYEAIICCFEKPDGSDAWWGVCSEDNPLCIKQGDGCPA